VSDIMRAALETYLTAPQPLPPFDRVSDTRPDVSDTIRPLSDVVSDIADIQARLTHLEEQVTRLSAGVRQRPTRLTPPGRTPPDVDAAYQRMRVLQGEGYSLTAIATQLDREGFRTKQGRAWHKSTVSYVLRTHGR